MIDEFSNPCSSCVGYTKTRCILGVIEWFGMLCGKYEPKVSVKTDAEHPKWMGKTDEN